MGRWECGAHPVDDAVETSGYGCNICVLPVRGHIAFRVAVAHPVEGCGKHLLPFRVALYIGAPLLLHRVQRVAVDGLQRCDKRTTVDGVVHLLVVERNTGDVDDLEPLLYLLLRAIADVERQGCLGEQLLQLRVERVIFLLAPVIAHCELVGEEAAEGSDALLTVEHLKQSVRPAVKIDKAQWIAVQHRVDDRHVLAPVVVDVVALVLRLDYQPSVHAEESLSLLLVIDESLADVADGDVGMQFCIHNFFGFYFSA